MSALPRIRDGGRAIGLAFVILLGVAQAAALGVVAFATRAAFASLHGGQPLPLYVLGALLGGGIASAALHLWGRVEGERLGQRYAADLRHALYSHIAGMTAETLASRRLGALSLRFVGDLSAAKGWVAMGVTRGLASIAILPGAIAAMVLVSPALAPVALLPLMAAAAVTAGVAVGLGDRHRGLRRKRGRIAIDMMERIAIAPQLDLAGRTGQELDRLDEAGRDLTEDAASRTARAELLRALMAGGSAVAGVAVMAMAARQAIPAAEVAAMLAVLSILMLPLADLAGVWDRFCGWRVARERCRALLALPSQRREQRREGAVVLGLGSLGEVPAGALAIVSGQAPGGVLRAAAAQGGGWEVDYGLPQGRLPRIAYVSERPMILRGSLRRALSLGAQPRPNPQAIRQVARRFGLGPLLDRVGSTKTRVAEGGQDLTNGEKLRVELTRAALMHPDLVVIDHPQIGPDHPLLAQLRKATGATILIGRETEGPLRLTLARAA